MFRIIRIVAQATATIGTFAAFGLAMTGFLEWSEAFALIAFLGLVLGIMLVVAYGFSASRRPAQRRMRSSQFKRAGITGLLIVGCLTLMSWAAWELSLDEQSTLGLVVIGAASVVFTGILMLISFALFLWVLPYIPFGVETLSNDPNENRPEGDLERDYEPSRFGFFTGLQPGQVKIIERNLRFRRCIMKYEDHAFLGHLPLSEQKKLIPGRNNRLEPNEEDYWRVTSVKDSPYPETEPIPDPGRGAKLFQRLVYRWSKHVYDITGFVFIGIYPWDRVRVYPMDRYMLERDDTGRYHPKLKRDYSDHYRVEDFQFPAVVSDVDTRDKMPLKVLLNFIGRVKNAYSTAYKTDDNWASRLLSAIAHAIATKTRTIPADKMLSARTQEESEALRKAVLEIDFSKVSAAIGQGQDITGIDTFGIEAVDTYILDISTVSEADQQALAALARARVQRDSAKALAVGDAASVREVAKAAKEYGNLGELALSVRGRVDTAKALKENPNAIVFLGDGGSNRPDPVNAAILREVRRNPNNRNRNRRNEDQ